jgi:hypothetical protein
MANYLVEIFKKRLQESTKSGFFDIGLLWDLAYEQSMPILNSKVSGFCMTYCLIPLQVTSMFHVYKIFCNLIVQIEQSREGVIQYSGFNIQNRTE